MRKLMLISALLLASASAHAGPSRGLMLAAADTPAVTTDAGQPAATTDAAQPGLQPLPPANQADAPKSQASDQAKPRASRPHTQSRRYEGDEAKARRIAAKYGISW
jgi:hypothetical protein